MRSKLAQSLLSVIVDLDITSNSHLKVMTEVLRKRWNLREQASSIQNENTYYTFHPCHKDKKLSVFSSKMECMIKTKLSKMLSLEDNSLHWSIGSIHWYILTLYLNYSNIETGGFIDKYTNKKRILIAESVPYSLFFVNVINLKGVLILNINIYMKQCLVQFSPKLSLIGDSRIYLTYRFLSSSIIEYHSHLHLTVV